ncbi:MAG: hypothetical protein R2881_02830 [Eubacteriales bacterium]
MKKRLRLRQRGRPFDENSSSKDADEKPLSTKRKPRLPLGVTDDDLDAAIGESVLLSMEVLQEKRTSSI